MVICYGSNRNKYIYQFRERKIKIKTQGCSFKKILRVVAAPQRILTVSTITDNLQLPVAALMTWNVLQDSIPLVVCPHSTLLALWLGRSLHRRGFILLFLSEVHFVNLHCLQNKAQTWSIISEPLPLKLLLQPHVLLLYFGLYFVFRQGKMLRLCEPSMLLCSFVSKIRCLLHLCCLPGLSSGLANPSEFFKAQQKD